MGVCGCCRIGGLKPTYSQLYNLLYNRILQPALQSALCLAFILCAPVVLVGIVRILSHTPPRIYHSILSFFTGGGIFDGFSKTLHSDGIKEKAVSHLCNTAWLAETDKTAFPATAGGTPDDRVFPKGAATAIS